MGWDGVLRRVFPRGNLKRVHSNQSPQNAAIHLTQQAYCEMFVIRTYSQGSNPPTYPVLVATSLFQFGTK